MPIGAYIAKLAGTAPNFTVIRFGHGPIANAPSGETGWVDVDFTPPSQDFMTQVRTTPSWTVAADGSVVYLTFNVETFQQPYAALFLVDYANQQSQALANAGLTLPNGVQLSTTNADTGALYDIMKGMQDGLIPSPYTVQSSNGGFIDLFIGDIQAAVVAISQFRQGNYNRRKACIAAIEAGTIVNEAAILAAL